MERRIFDVYRTLQINIKKGHKLYDYFYTNCVLNTNLYNVANYIVRQYSSGKKNFEEFCPLYKNQLEVFELVENITKDTSYYPSENKWLSYNQLDYILKETKNVDYYALPSQVNQQTLKLLFNDYKSFFESIKKYQSNPELFLGIPKLPKYKDNKKPSTIKFTNQICKIKDGKYIRFPKTNGQINIGKMLNQYVKDTNNELNNDIRLKEIRVKPYHNLFVVDVVMEINNKDKSNNDLSAQLLEHGKEYEKLLTKRFNEQANKDYIKKTYKDFTTFNERALSIDIGLSNLCAIVNNFGKSAIILNGNPLRARNQYYNKILASRKSLAKKCNDVHTTKYIDNITRKRNNFIRNYMHKTSRYITNYAIENKVNVVFVGHNNLWKQESNLGKETNQSFVQIPFNVLISQLSYKLLEVGIKLVLVDESYTSKSSFLDLDDIPNYKDIIKEQNKESNTTNKSFICPAFSGKRLYRGLYQSKNGTLINADVNGAANILRKAFPKIEVWDSSVVNTRVFRVNIAKY